MPLGIPFFLKTTKHSEQFECISITSKPSNLSWKYLPQTLVYPTSQKKEQISFCSKQVNMTKEKPFLYTLDGELYQTKKNNIDISLGPKLTFIITEQT